MNRLDLIIDALQNCSAFQPKNYYDIDKALAAARELRAMKPVGYMDSKGVLFNNTTHPHLNIALYALDEPLAQPEQKPCKCIDEFWCATFDRCKRNELI